MSMSHIVTLMAAPHDRVDELQILQLGFGENGGNIDEILLSSTQMYYQIPFFSDGF